MLSHRSVITPETQQDRIQRFKQYCKNHQANDTRYPGKSAAIVVYDDLKVAAVTFGKVMSCSIIGIMIQAAYARQHPHGPPLVQAATGSINGSFVHGKSVYKKFNLENIGLYTLQEVEEKLKSFDFIYIFVRDPFDRLVSAYNDKLKNSKAGEKCAYCGLARKIMERYRTPEEITPNSTVTFQEFLKFSLTSNDPHWAPYVYLVYPCKINLTFIGKYETRDEDIPVVLQYLYKKNIPEFPKANAKPRSDTLNDYYSNVDMETKLALTERYQADFEMFGYDPLRFF